MDKYLNKILLDDCLNVLRNMPSESVDAVITDPPYSSGGLTHAERSKDPIEKYQQTGTKLVRPSFAGDNKDARSWLHWCTLWISECNRITKKGGYFLMFSDWRQLPLASDALQFGDYVWRGIVDGIKRSVQELHTKDILDTSVNTLCGEQRPSVQRLSIVDLILDVIVFPLNSPISTT